MARTRWGNKNAQKEVTEDENRERSPVGQVGRSEEDGERDRSPVWNDESERSPVRSDDAKRAREESVQDGRSEEEKDEGNKENLEEEKDEGNKENLEEESDRSRDEDEEAGRNGEEGDTVADEGSTSRTVSDSRGSEEEMVAPLQPLRMYFAPSEYTKKIKLATRCFIFEALKTLEGLEYPLTTFERKWFEEHPQFKHIFHMPRERNHKVMGMWMLLLRTACIEKKKEAWFVVNGTPIRYGIKEHALISGLNCCNYPVNYSKVGSEAFVKRHFKGQTIRYQDVKTKLQEMVPVDRSRDRLKMAVLFFLSSVVRAQTKTGDDATPVESFFLRAVDDLNFCKTFPWGRYSFDHMLGEIEHTMTHFDGTVKGTLWPVPGFCIPMELLAFEAIPDLGNKFLEDYPGADENCPRMCKKMFKKGECKGFPLSKIYKALGPTVDIDSIIPVRDEESSLMAEITEEDDDDDKHDVVVDSWMQCIRKGLTITLDEMYDQDVASRVEKEPQDAVNEEIAAANEPGVPTFAELVDVINKMGSQMNKLGEKFDGFEKRLGSLEANVKAPAEVYDTDGFTEPVEEHNAGSTEPPSENVVPSPDAPNEHDVPSPQGVKRTAVFENQNKRVTRSKTNAV